MAICMPEIRFSAKWQGRRYLDKWRGPSWVDYAGLVVAIATLAYLAWRG
jgi:hypothetical protein